MSDLKKALEATNITLRKYDSDKVKPIYTSKGATSVPKFTEEIVSALGNKLIDHPAIVNAINNPDAMIDLVEEYIDAEGMEQGEEQKSIPAAIAHLVLNVDKSSKEPGAKRFFCTTPEEIIDPHTSGLYYMESIGLSIPEAVKFARSVVPKYLPRNKPGVNKEMDPITKDQVNYFNRYLPPEWTRWKKDHPNSWERLPDKAPPLLLKFLKHLIPLKAEREYLYAWIYASLTNRSYVFLVLQGSPGVGKNRLKILLRALHGAANSADGKKETFGANDSKFNSQMEENTLVWFDELKYGPDMEARMKEYQNDYISIERKGVDATRSTKIYSSMVVSNNYQRDNYLLFNSRKFAPLVLADKDLKFTMTPAEISMLSEKLDPDHPAYDGKFVAQIAKWIFKYGPVYLKRYPTLEYQGPKFWELAHASMSKWQKTAVVATTSKPVRGPLPGWDSAKQAFLWSKVEEQLRRKKEFESREYRDPSTVKVFFDSYRDKDGKKVFETEDIGKTETSFQDFWIKPIGGGNLNMTVNIPATNGGGVPDFIKNSAEMQRPAGMSQFQWRKMKEQLEGKDHDQDEDDTDIL